MTTQTDYYTTREVDAEKIVEHADSKSIGLKQAAAFLRIEPPPIKNNMCFYLSMYTRFTYEQLRDFFPNNNGEYVKKEGPVKRRKGHGAGARRRYKI